MTTLADSVASDPSAPGEPGGHPLSGRRYELVHSAMVAAPGGAAEGDRECQCLVSVLREEWEVGVRRARLRLMHTAPGLGPLVSVVTGGPVPWIVRLRGGEISPFREVVPAPIGLEVRPVGRAEGARALRAFRLMPASSYTIVIAGCGEHAAEVIEWSPDNAE